MEDDIQQLKDRIDRIEREVMAIKSSSPAADQPWWKKVAGRFENDAAFDEIVRLGREYRESQTHEDE